MGDGALSIRKQLASEAGVTEAVAQTLSGADLEIRKLERQSNLSGVDGARLTQAAGERSNVFTIYPSSGAAAGGETVVIFGEGMEGATGVVFGVDDGTSLDVIDDYHLDVVTPAVGASTVDVIVQHPDGDITLTAAFTFV